SLVHLLLRQLLTFLRHSPPTPHISSFPYTTLFRSDRGHRDAALLADTHRRGHRRAVRIGRRRERLRHRHRSRLARPRRAVGLRRSEEHTSELQSHLNLVCRLLLEKKKAYITLAILC